MFDVDGPIQLRNGIFVCAAHQLEICHWCTCDYTVLREGGSDDDIYPDEFEAGYDSDHPSDYESGDDVDPEFITVISPRAVERGPVVGNGRVFPTMFRPLDGYTPQRQFLPLTTLIPMYTRYCNRKNRGQGLIYTDGACLDNGRHNAKGGCAFVFREPVPGAPHASSCKFPLEDEGPTGERHPQTSNRAELRAVIAALRYRFWTGEGFNSMVIATDSEYVALGATSWVRGWVRNGWKAANGQPVKNKDLWQCLLGEVERWSDGGLQVLFWRIPREQNTVADRCAKDAAAEALTAPEPEYKGFVDVIGALI
ncbi:Ribonuclease H-like protein [Ascosphaera apis ARSEF 7405]|uniref:ribonuclease H n=1 Tax=Ascosphaera apis ARSEF 7405 TaxID=392613 RepID=A0A168BPM7_9EURO|nr:Ribonuclease H-like protein [Ascosphaera apis ARSEF 7405]